MEFRARASAILDIQSSLYCYHTVLMDVSLQLEMTKKKARKYYITVFLIYMKTVLNKVIEIVLVKYRKGNKNGIYNKTH